MTGPCGSVRGAATLLLLAVGACSPDVPAVSTETAVFQGAWFTVSYPASFEPRPSLPSSSADGYDSVFFEAPDGTVRFYVYSPQWGGDATDIPRDPDTEEKVDSTVTLEDEVTTTRTTFAARDGSWTRAYVATTDARGPTQWVIGWGWASEDARDRWKPAFELFRASLQQFTN